MQSPNDIIMLTSDDNIWCQMTYDTPDFAGPMTLTGVCERYLKYGDAAARDLMDSNAVIHGMMHSNSSTLFTHITDFTWQERIQTMDMHLYWASETHVEPLFEMLNSPSFYFPTLATLILAMFLTRTGRPDDDDDGPDWQKPEDYDREDEKWLHEFPTIDLQKRPLQLLDISFHKQNRACGHLLLHPTIVAQETTNLTLRASIGWLMPELRMDKLETLVACTENTPRFLSALAANARDSNRKIIISANGHGLNALRTITFPHIDAYFKIPNPEDCVTIAESLAQLQTICPLLNKVQYQPNNTQGMKDLIVNGRLVRC